MPCCGVSIGVNSHLPKQLVGPSGASIAVDTLVQGVNTPGTFCGNHVASANHMFFFQKLGHAAPPHTSNPSYIALLFSEMRTKWEGDQFQQDCEETHTLKKAHLEEQSKITIIVTAVQPAPMGEHRLQASKGFGNTDFYMLDAGHVSEPSDKKIAQGIINTSVHTTLTFGLLDLNFPSEFLNNLMLKFRIIKHAMQIQAWHFFINIDPAKQDMNSGLHEAFINAGK
ncbi:hypothetical protein VP01_3027g1 [Puccinia sorghi]|uniref:Uncharacterized protein n=1 Tax=Puccinia sorghi TaxID=27349 RepID=A0A0L6V0V7_9BASI|nr:hypothetical protein VP01_3027g1 [Puccinia sorghi]